MANSKRKWQLSDVARVRLGAAQAALVAFVYGQIPAPVGLALDAAGLDPVAWKQRRMLARLDAAAPSGEIQDGRRAAMKARSEREVAAQLGKGLTRTAAHVLTRLGKAGAARAAKRSVPVVSGAIAAVLAYRQTVAMGLTVIEPQSLRKQ